MIIFSGGNSLSTLIRVGHCCSSSHYITHNLQITNDEWSNVFNSLAVIFYLIHNSLSTHYNFNWHKREKDIFFYSNSINCDDPTFSAIEKTYYYLWKHLIYNRNYLFNFLIVQTDSTSHEGNRKLIYIQWTLMIRVSRINLILLV